MASRNEVQHYHQKPKHKKWRGPLGIFIKAFVATLIVFFALYQILIQVSINPGERTIEVFSNEIDPTRITFLKVFDVTTKVIKIGDVDTSKVGTYNIKYIVGVCVVNQTVNVVDTQAPQIILNGEAEVSVKNMSYYNDLGVEATDNYDGDITGRVKHNVTPIESKKYKVTYYVSDSSGNTATAERIVNVVS